MNPKRNALDIIANVLAVMFIVASIVVVAINWGGLPANIPSHINAAGEADRWLQKSKLIIYIVVQVFMFGLFFMLERNPQAWVKKKPGKEYTQKAYRVLKNMIVMEKIIIVLACAVATIMISFQMILPAMFIPVVFIAIFGCILFHMGRIHSGM